MADREAIGIWRSRLRWRLRGAWQWPTFAVATVVDAVLLAELPFTGMGTGPVGALLLAGFLNLAIVAAVGPLLGMALRRRRPTLPRDVARENAGAIALIAAAALLALGGLMHRDDVHASKADYSAAVLAARRYLAHQGPAEYRPALARSNTWQQGPHLYRTCFPGSDRRRSFCVIVNTEDEVITTRPDPNQQPNDVVAGPGNPGRAAP